VIQLLKKRFATRSIALESLSKETIEQLMEAVRLTPSCFNRQPWRFLFLEGEEARAKGKQVLSDGNKPWASRAPLLVIGYASKDDDCVLPDRSYYQFDLGMSVMNLILAATEQGLVARPMAGFDPNQARELFGLSQHEEPLIMLAIGKPSLDEDHLPEHYKGISKKPRERKPANEFIQRL